MIPASKWIEAARYLSYVKCRAVIVKTFTLYKLESVDWRVQGTALVDDVLVPSRYVALATYSDKASFSTHAMINSEEDPEIQEHCRTPEDVIDSSGTRFLPDEFLANAYLTHTNEIEIVDRGIHIVYSMRY